MYRLFPAWCVTMLKYVKWDLSPSRAVRGGVLADHRPHPTCTHPSARPTEWPCQSGACPWGPQLSRTRGMGDRDLRPSSTGPGPPSVLARLRGAGERCVCPLQPKAVGCRLPEGALPNKRRCTSAASIRRHRGRPQRKPESPEVVKTVEKRPPPKKSLHRRIAAMGCQACAA